MEEPDQSASEAEEPPQPSRKGRGRPKKAITTPAQVRADLSIRLLASLLKLGVDGHYRGSSCQGSCASSRIAVLLSAAGFRAFSTSPRGWGRGCVAQAVSGMCAHEAAWHGHLNVKAHALQAAEASAEATAGGAVATGAKRGRDGVIKLKPYTPAKMVGHITHPV